MALVDLNIKDFTEELASASPAPGGGSVAALCGVLGTALCQMVSNLTLGRKKYDDAQDVMTDIKDKTHETAASLLQLVDEDTESYNRVIGAYKLPTGTSAEKQRRQGAIQDALKAAAATPFKTLEVSAAAMPLVQTVIENGNPNCITDAGVAAELINTAVRGAAYNVCINLMDIRDQAFASDLKQKAAAIVLSVQKQTDSVRNRLNQAVNLEK